MFRNTRVKMRCGNLVSWSFFKCARNSRSTVLHIQTTTKGKTKPPRFLSEMSRVCGVLFSLPVSFDLQSFNHQPTSNKTCYVSDYILIELVKHPSCTIIIMISNKLFYIIKKINILSKIK